MSNIERTTYAKLVKGDRVQIMEAVGRAAELNAWIAAPARAPKRARWATVTEVTRGTANTTITIEVKGISFTMSWGSRTRITREIAAASAPLADIPAAV
jgi:hypothetical protein